MTSLVTGATGFVGRHLVAQLAGQGVRVRALYRDREKGLRYLNCGEEAIIGDVCDPAVTGEAVRDVDAVFHCAAAHSTAPADEIRRVGVPSLRTLIEAVRAAGCAPRIIVMSSLNVLGNRSYAAATEAMPRRRTKELHVDLKIAAEELAEDAMADGLDIVVLRPGLIYGPGEPHLPKLAQAVCTGKFTFIGSRENIVPLVHVSDMVQVMNLAAGAAKASGRIYHITDGSSTTIGQLVGQLARVLNCPEPTRTLPKVVPQLANTVCGLLGRSGPISQAALRFLGSSRHVDISRARSELGFQPHVGIAEGVDSMANWLRGVVASGAAA